MAKITQLPEIRATATLHLDEDELGALDALAGYGTDNFLQIFYQHMGTHYLKPYERGLRSLFASVRSQVPTILSRARDARAVFNGEKCAVPPPPKEPT